MKQQQKQINKVSFFRLVMLVGVVLALLLDVWVSVGKVQRLVRQRMEGQQVQTDSRTNNFLYKVNLSEEKKQMAVANSTNRPSQHTQVNGVASYFSVPILMYHHVGSLPAGVDKIRQDLTVSPENFQAQVRWLKSKGYESLTLDQAYAVAHGQMVAPAKPVVFTFDDGYADVFENAVPVLRESGYVGSFAIITKMVGQPDYATWEQIEAAHKQGMEMVSHTQTHFDGGNKKYSAEYIRGELTGSFADLQAHGIATNILIYPYGHYSDLYQEVAKQVGVKMALTVKFGTGIDPELALEVPRWRVHEGTTIEKFQRLFGNK